MFLRNSASSAGEGSAACCATRTPAITVGFCSSFVCVLRAALSDAGDGGAYATEVDTIYIAGGTHHTDGTQFSYSSTHALFGGPDDGSRVAPGGA